MPKRKLSSNDPNIPLSIEERAKISGVSVPKSTTIRVEFDRRDIYSDGTEDESPQPQLHSAGEPRLPPSTQGEDRSRTIAFGVIVGLCVIILVITILPIREYLDVPVTFSLTRSANSTNPIYSEKHDLLFYVDSGTMWRMNRLPSFFHHPVYARGNELISEKIVLCSSSNTPSYPSLCIHPRKLQKSAFADEVGMERPDIEQTIKECEALKRKIENWEKDKQEACRQLEEARIDTIGYKVDLERRNERMFPDL
ncbi:hypothetical protein BLNAU_13586 [Blattamonas nauphoetae]|uniref:Uncharacterized protein n=1 Tax=Blattamonas nauphoetae TaxID=2049346 RepID=A0ABQ9XKR9_9EUKA|nr:hypothetical protein BLNAU_13586 [Blattamonas nauphoetae]